MTLYTRTRTTKSAIYVEVKEHGTPTWKRYPWNVGKPVLHNHMMAVKRYLHHHHGVVLPAGMSPHSILDPVQRGDFGFTWILDETLINSIQRRSYEHDN